MYGRRFDILLLGDTIMNKKPRAIALGGIFGALCVLTLLAAVYMPTNTLFFYGASSMFVAFVVLETGIGAGWLFYASTVLLSFLLIPDKLAVLPYAAFFGIYGLIKCHIESLRKIVAEYILKGIFFVVCETGIYLLYTKVFAVEIISKIPIHYIVLLMIPVFYIYDYLYTRLLGFYIRKFSGKR
jgi:hypothetical protein